MAGRELLLRASLVQRPDSNWIRRLLAQQMEMRVHEKYKVKMALPRFLAAAVPRPSPFVVCVRVCFAPTWKSPNIARQPLRGRGQNPSTGSTVQRYWLYRVPTV